MSPDEHWQRAATTVLRHYADGEPARIEWLLSQIHENQNFGKKPTAREMIEILERDKRRFELRPMTSDGQRFDYGQFVNDDFGLAQAKGLPRLAAVRRQQRDDRRQAREERHRRHESEREARRDRRC